MLDYIRSNAQSFGVKAAFGIIILVFVFWGVGSLRDANSPGVVATVNGKPILMRDMENTLRQAEESMRRTNPGITNEQMQAMQLTRQVWQQMVMETALLQEATRLDISVSPVDMRRAIEAMPIFQNAQGKFDPEAYKRIMSAQRQSLAAFEEGVRRRLLEEKLHNDVTAGASLSLEEARIFFNFAQEQREVEYVFFAATDYTPPAPAEDELKAYYESNRQGFAIPAKLDVEYILARPADLGKPESFSAEDVQAWYEKNIAKFTAPARAKVRHILLRLAPNAPEAEVKKVTEAMAAIATEAAKGGDFATLARKHSQDEGSGVNGGDLDWIRPGDTVPAFNDAVFSMKAGEISKPVRSDFGLHLIKVDNKEEPKVTPLKDVEKEARATLAEQQGMDKLRETLDLLIEGNIVGKPLPDVGKPHGLVAKQSGLLPLFELEKLLGIQTKDAQALLNIPAGSPLDTALESTNNSFVILRVKEKTAAGTRPYEEVKGDIIKIINTTKGREAALKAAADARKALSDPTKLPAPLAAKVKAAPAVQRGAPLTDLSLQPEALGALFTAKPLEWMPAVFEADLKDQKGAVMLRVKKTVLPGDEVWQPMGELLRSSLEQTRKQEMFQAFVSILLQRAQIDIKNPTYLNQRGMN